jgi:hypothetical protein
MSKLEIALFFHILGALLFVAGVVTAGVAFEAARRRHQPAEIALLLGLTRVGVLLVVVGALDVLGFGLWLVHRPLGPPPCSLRAVSFAHSLCVNSPARRRAASDEAPA